MTNEINNRTTAQFFEDFQKNIENFNPEDWDEGTTKEILQAQYDCYREIYNTMLGVEFELLYYLRYSRRGATLEYMRVAKKQFEAYREYLSLFKDPSSS